jgi:choline monooxygenase
MCPTPGDAQPIDFLGVPLLLVRDQEGELRLFQNVCRHRGMILVAEKKNFRGVIRCPYHSWCYSMTGELKATPHAGGPGLNEHDSVDKATTGLMPVRMGVFLDAVFADLSGEAEPFEDYVAPLAALGGLHGPARLSWRCGFAASRWTSTATGSWPSRTIARAITCLGSIRG